MSAGPDEIPDEVSDEDLDRVEEAGEQVAEASANVGTRLKWAARGLWFGILLVIVVGIAVAVYLGYIEPQLTFTGTVNIGWIVEYVLAAVAGVIIVGLVSALMIALPGSFISALVALLVSVGQTLNEE